MKQEITTRSHAPNAMRLLRAFIALILLTGTGLARAQTPQAFWESGFPKFDNSRIVTMEGENTLKIRFAAFAAPITQPKLVVTFPTGVDFVSAAGVDGGISFVGTPALDADRKLVLNISGTLAVNAMKEVHIKVKAPNCTQSAAVNFKVLLMNGTDTLKDGLGNKFINAPANIVKPTLTLTPQSAVVNFASQTETKTITYYLKTTTADKVSSAKVTFTTPDAQTTLSNFQVKGASVSVTETPIGGGKTQYTFDVTPAVLGGAQQIDNTNSTAITFTAASTGVGTHRVTTAVQFPSGTPCTSNPGSPVQLAFPILTLPHMVHLHTYYTNSSDDSVHYSKINMDGSTPTILKTVFRNTGGPAKEIEFKFWCYGEYNYIDPDNIDVQVGSSGSRERVDASNIVTIASVNNGPAHKERYGTMKSTVLGKPKWIHVTIRQPLEGGETITFWIPTINGNIYENSTTDNVYYNYYTNTINGFTSNVLSVKAADGKAGTMETMPSVRLIWLNSPHYREVPASLNLRGTQTKTQTVYVAPGSTNDADVELHVKAPPFLKITDMKLLPQADGLGSIPTTPTIVDDHHRYLTVSGKGNRGETYLHVTYEGEPCGATNKSGKIEYWANHNWQGGTMERVTHVYQDATQLCEVAGIVLDTFHLVRTTVGRKDTNDDHIPDDASSLAPANEIRNDVYIEGDKGHFYWKGTVQSTGYSVVDMPITLADGLEFDTSIKMDRTGNGYVNTAANGTVKFTKTNGHEGVVRFTPSASLSNGDRVEVEAPFTIIKGINKTVGIETEMSVRTTPSSPSVGKDKASVTMGTYAIDSLNWWYQDIFKFSFPDNSVVDFNGTGSPSLSLGYADIFHYIYFPPPYFKNEARVVRYLDTLEFDMPKGYHLIPDIEVQREGLFGSGMGPTRVTVSPDGSPTETRRRYAVAAAAYDFTYYHGGTLAPGKWPLPDDRWRIYSYGKIQAYPSASREPSYMYRTSVWRNPVTNTVTRNTIKIEFTYTGPGNTVSASPDTVNAKGSRIKTTTLQVGKQSSASIPNLYFYFDGPIKDVKLENIGTHIEYNGQGLDNRWVGVDASITNTQTYEMTYTYKNFETATCNQVDTVRVYTGFGSNANWPDFTKPMNLDSANFSAADTFFITMDNPASLRGWISAKRDSIPAQNGPAPNHYTVYAVFEAMNTGGAVKNPTVKLTIPPHQWYKSGSAKLRHDGQERSLNASSPTETALSGILTDHPSPQTVELHLKDFGSGNLLVPSGALEDSLMRRDTLVLDMYAGCGTDFTGITYSGAFTGTDVCGNDAGGGSNQKRLFPIVTYNYRFGETNLAMKEMVAFNEFRTRDTLTFDFKRVIGFVNDMDTADCLLLRLPKPIKVGDSVHYTCPTWPLNKYITVTAANDSVSPTGAHFVKVPLPIEEYKTHLNKGENQLVTCTIPVIYNRPSGADSTYLIEHPVDTVEASIRLFARFGNCPPRPFKDGLQIDSIAMAMAKGPFPPRLYVGEEDSLQILSKGFHGYLYKDSTRNPSSLVFSGPGPVWKPMPRDTNQLGDTLYYFSPLFGPTDFGGAKSAPIPNTTHQGVLPFPVKIWIHPWFIKNLPRFKYICEEEDTLRVKGGGMDIRYQWFRDEVAIPGATDTTLVVRESGFYYVQITDTVPETVTSDTCEVVFREIPVILEDLKDIRDCDKIYIPLAVKHTGRYMLYQWYRNGLPIKGATDSIYRASAYDSSGFYRVRVMNPCGDSVMSRRCYVDFCDDRWDGPARVVDLYTPATVETQPSTVRNIIPSHTDFNFTIHARKGQSLRYITITASHPNWTEQGGGIERTMITDSLMQVRVRRVTHNLEIHVGGVSPTGNDLVSDASRRAWTHHGRLYLHTDRAQSVRLYTPMGFLYREQSLPAGLTVVSDLPTGIYLVRFADGHAEKVRVE